MTAMAGRRAINLKVLANIKSLGKTKAVTIKVWEEGDIKKVPGSVTIFWCDKQFDKKCLTQITNEALIRRERRAHESLVPNQNSAS